MARKDVQLGLFERIPPRMWTPDKIYDVETAFELELVGESQVFERKPCGIHARELAEWIAAWSIVEPDGGVIGVGILNDGTLQGCISSEPQHINRLEQVRDYCPDARIETKKVPFDRDGKQDFVLLIRVKYRSDKLVRTTDGKAYRREGDSKKKLKEEEAREIERDIGQTSFEQEPCHLAYPDDFDTDAIASWANRAKEKNNWDFSTPSEQVLTNLNLGTINPPPRICAEHGVCPTFREQPAEKNSWLSNSPAQISRGIGRNWRELRAIEG